MILYIKKFKDKNINLCIMTDKNIEYNIEDNLDFYSLLERSDDLNTDIDNICLISFEPLQEKFVTMDCGHQFNYIPLFKYTHTLKTTRNPFITKSYCLAPYQMKCPYCRFVQNSLLDYEPDLVSDKIYGVNTLEPETIDDFSQFLMNTIYLKYPRCQFFELNPQYEPTIKESKNNLKYNFCCSYGQKLSNSSYKCCEIGRHYNNKLYCSEHKLKVIELIEPELIQRKLNAHKKCIALTKKGIICGCKVYKDEYCKRHQNNLVNNEIMT